MSLTTITVTGTYVDANGDPVPGFITFMLSSELQDTSTSTIVSRERIKRYLDSSGSMSVDLIATNDPTTEPLGATYKVSEYIRDHLERVYNIELPYDTPGGTIDLADIAPVTYTELFSYVLVGAFNDHVNTLMSTTVLGHAKIDGTTIGLNEDEQLEVIGGGGATELDGLTDVVITDPEEGQVLKYNGSEWVNDTDETGGSGGAYSTDIGDGVETDIVVTHGLGTRDVEVEVYSATTPWETVDITPERTDLNTVTFHFPTAPTTNQYRVVIMSGSGGGGGGMENPMTSIGDLIIGGVGGTPERLGAGSLQPLVLTQIDGVPAWAALNQASGETFKVLFNNEGDVALRGDGSIATGRY